MGAAVFGTKIYVFMIWDMGVVVNWKYRISIVFLSVLLVSHCHQLQVLFMGLICLAGVIDGTTTVSAGVAYSF